MNNRKKIAHFRRQMKINKLMKHKTSSGERDRLIVSKSNRHIIAQVVNSKGIVLGYKSTMDKSLYKPNKSLCNREYAFEVGKALINQLKESNHSLLLAFDRNGFNYHGVIKNVADGARSVGGNF